MVVSKIVKEGKAASTAYAEVYPVQNSNVAAANASRLLGNANVQNALQEALRAEGIDEASIATELVKIRKSWDWKAKDAYVKHAAKFLGYDQQQGSPIAQVGNIVNNWKVTK
jgi:hypothetical protein